MGNINHIRYLPHLSEYVDFAVKSLKTIIFNKYNPDNHGKDLYEIENQGKSLTIETDELVLEFKKLTNLDFNFFIPNKSDNIEKFLSNNYHRQFECFSGKIIYRNTFSDKDEVTRHNLKLAKFSEKNKYLTRPSQNSYLHNQTYNMTYNKNNDLSLISSKDNKNNNKLYNCLENQIRIDNIIKNKIGNLDDSMISVKMKKKEIHDSMNDYNEYPYLSYDESDQDNCIINNESMLMDIDSEKEDYNRREIAHISLLEDEE